VRLKESGFDLVTIGLLSLFHLPFALKPFLAPLIDRLDPPFWRGERREGWLFTSLLATFIALLGVGFFPSNGAWIALLSFATGLLFLAGVQVEVVLARATGQLAASASVVSGYRMGLLLAGGGTLILAEGLGWELAYVAIAALLFLPLLWRERLPILPLPPEPLSFINPLKNLLVKGWPLFLFLFFYRLGDDLADPMLRPYFLEVGFSKVEIAELSKGLGMAATLLGVAVAGWVKKIPSPLILFGILHALSFFLFSFLENSPLSLASCICVEHFSGGLVITAFIASLWREVTPVYATTQYALLWSLLSLKRNLVGSLSGFLATALGWPLFFSVIGCLALCGVFFAIPMQLLTSHRPMPKI
jgi:PAT family beta-lactamase induction signal transducer AmpG